MTKLDAINKLHGLQSAMHLDLTHNGYSKDTIIGLITKIAVDVAKIDEL